MNRDPAIAALPVIDVLESLDVAYYIGGSLASSYLGVGRSTVDVDIIAAFSKEDVAGFVANLESAYYVDTEMILDAIDRSSSFNVIHFESTLKVDVFCRPTLPGGDSAMARAQEVALFPESERKVRVATAEDTVIAKLVWFKMSPSDRQWSDVQGVLKVQAEKLDLAYLRNSAVRDGVADLLDKALKEAEL